MNESCLIWKSRVIKSQIWIRHCTRVNGHSAWHTWKSFVSYEWGMAQICEVLQHQPVLMGTRGMMMWRDMMTWCDVTWCDVVWRADMMHSYVLLASCIFRMLWCSVLQRIATCRSVLQRVAVCCSVSESCHICKWLRSHIWLSHVTHMLWISHVTHSNESDHIHEWVMSYVRMSHVTYTNESYHTCE